MSSRSGAGAIIENTVKRNQELTQITSIGFCVEPGENISEIEPGPQWWEASAFITAPYLLPLKDLMTCFDSYWEGKITSGGLRVIFLLEWEVSVTANEDLDNDCHCCTDQYNDFFILKRSRHQLFSVLFLGYY